MDLNSDQQHRLEKIFDAWNGHSDKLNKWLNETFLPSNQENYQNDTTWTGEKGYFVSPKMWNIFSEVEEKLGIDHESSDQKEAFQSEDGDGEEEYSQEF